MATFIKISTITVGSGGAASIDFTSIPATYTDLKLVCSTRSTGGGGPNDGLYIKVNGATTNSSVRWLYGSGSAASSANGAFFYLGEGNANSATASTFSSHEIYIPNYAGANYKSMSVDSVAETNAAAQYMSLNALLWSQTTAINQLTLYFASTNNVAQYSSATLYGIKSS